MGQLWDSCPINSVFRGVFMAAFERRSGAWRAKIRRDGYPPISRTFTKKAEAEEWAGRIEAEMRQGQYIDRREAEETTFAEALERYAREVTPKKKGARQELNRIHAWTVDPLSKRSLASLRGADFSKWRDARLATGKSPTTVRNDLALISHLFCTAIKEWGLGSLLNPIEKIKVPSPARARDRRLSPRPDADGTTEEARLINACRSSNSQWLAPIVQLAIETAMRQGELLTLEWTNVDLERGVAVLQDTKNGERRHVPLSTSAIRILKDLLTDETGIMRLPTGRVFPLNHDQLTYHWRVAVKAAGLEDLRFHDLRHEAASRLFEKGLNPMEAAAVTGHKTLAMLKRYTHLRAEDLAKKLG